MEKSKNTSQSIREISVRDEETKDNMVIVERGNSQALISDCEGTSIQDNSQQICLQRSEDTPQKVKKIKGKLPLNRISVSSRQ